MRPVTNKVDLWNLSNHYDGWLGFEHNRYATQKVEQTIGKWLHVIETSVPAMTTIRNLRRSIPGETDETTH